MKARNVIFILLIFPLIGFSQKMYRGGEIYSYNSWMYGKVEMRMKMAKGSGMLSTFFTYKNGSEISGTFWEEIDIEVLGKEEASLLQSNIITGNPRKTSEELYKVDSSLSDDYHTYTLEWTPDYLAWYLDGILIRKSEGEQVKELTNPQTLRMNIWAAKWVEWVGEFDTKALPQYQFINWIEYSAYTPGEGDDGGDFTKEWRDNFNAFDYQRWNKANWTFDGNLVKFTPDNVIVKDGYLILAITNADNTGYTGNVPRDYLEHVAH